MHRDLGPALRSTSSRSLSGRALSGQSVSARGDRVRLHDSALPLRIFFKSERGYCIDTDSQGKVLKLAKKIERAGGKQLAGVSPGMGALEIHDQGSNGAKTRGICFPALSVPVNT
jgi:hypothetical protein